MRTSRTIAPAFALLAGLGLGLAGCGGGLGTPEEAANTMVKKDLESLPDEMERQMEQLRWQIECDEKEMEWWADRGTMKNRIDGQRAMLEYMDDNLDKVVDEVTFDVVDIKKGPGDKGKEVTVSVWVYQPEEVAKGSKLFYLKPDRDLKRYHLVEVDKQWKRANKK